MREPGAGGSPRRRARVRGGAPPPHPQVVIVRPAPAAPPPAETRMVGGVVSDAGHAPIAGATVTVHGTSLQAVTGADGSFALPGVPLGEVTLDVTAPNQPPTSVAVPGDKAVVAITAAASAEPAAPGKRKLTGKVVDPSTKEPIAAAQVQVVGTDAVVFTGPDGAFELDNLPAGPIKLDISAPEHENRLLEVPAGQATVDV